MKRCPECRKDYFDDSLLYCLDDGAALAQSSVTDEPPTAVLSGEDLTRQLTADDSKKRANSIMFSLPSKVPWIAAGVIALAASVLAYAYMDISRTGNATAIRLAFEPPAGLSFNDVQPDSAVISPDGRKVAFSATVDGKNMLYVRELDGHEAKILPGSDNPLEPFWSPDSKSIGYGSNGKLKRSDINGGNAQVLCDAARMVGGAWNREGTIIFTPDYRTTLVQVSANGGEPEPIAMNAPNGETQRHRYPYFLPDGRSFLFLNELKGLWAGSLDSPEIMQIVPDNTPAVYGKGGWLLFIRNDSLVAQPFNASKLTLSGEPIPLISDQKSWINNFRFSVSETGVLMWQGVWEREYQLTWFDRLGKQVGSVEAPTKISTGMDPRISPDGKRLVIKRNPPNTVWVVDLDKGNSVRVTSDFAQMPLWSPDGSRLAYSGIGGLVTKASSGLGEPEVVIPQTQAQATFPCCWSPDGRYIIYQKRGVKTRLDLYAVNVDGEKKEVPLLPNSSFDERSPALSADGKWLAYDADDTGGWEIYVQRFSPDGTSVPDRKRVSTAGGRTAVWSRDGRELFFIATDGQLMSAAVTTSGETFEFETPKALFQTRMLSSFGSFHEFDVSPDGQRFLIGTLVGDSRSPSPMVILNWSARLEN